MGELLEQFREERDRMLMHGTVPAYVAFAKKWGLPLPSNEIICMAAIHKGRTAIPSLPIKARRESWAWLVERGFSTWDDGDIAASFS